MDSSELHSTGGVREENSGASLPRLVTPPPGPASRSLAKRLRDVESRNVTFVSEELPVFWSEAHGANVVDADGNRFLDLTSAFGVAAAGHQHPRIVEAIRQQAGRLSHGMGDVHPPALKVELLERLGALLPWREARGVLASTGSEAVEIAFKTAHLVTGRGGIIAFHGGYHGLTLGALSATARDDFRAPFRTRIPRNVAFIPFPDRSRDGEKGVWRALEALDEAVIAGRDRGEPPGCVIVEPIQGRGGVRIPPEGFLQEVQRKAHEAGAVVIFDEILTGLGRTGSLFAFQDEGVVPDLLCLGKALGGGLPLSACLGSRELMDHWPPSKGEALHTSTFLGHPLACAAGIAFLEVLEEEGLTARARDEGARLTAALSRALADVPRVAGVKGRGLLLGVELVVPPDPDDPGGKATPWAGGGAKAALEALHRGILILPAGDRNEVTELLPPLNTPREQLDWAAAELAELLAGLRESTRR